MGSLFLSCPGEARELHGIWAYDPTNDVFYWKNSVKSGTQYFRAFPHQLRAHAEGKTLAQILDNASIRHTKAIRKFTDIHSDVKIFHLALLFSKI